MLRIFLLFFFICFSLPVGLLACLGTGPIYLGHGSDESECLPDFDSGADALMEAGGMKATSTFFPPGEARDQALRYPGAVCASSALPMALRALLRNSEPESLAEVSQTIGLKDCGAQCYFNRKTSLFGLVADHRSAMRSRLLPLPASKSSVSDYWIFYLTVPDLDEHGYWALVPRDGSSIETFAQN